MKRYLFIVILFILFVADSGKYYAAADGFKDKVEKRFLERKELAKNRGGKLFAIFGNNLTKQEADALKFLYAYMPLSDLADYDGEFYLKQIRTALKARETFSWGRQVPDDIFRHFVLPCRVNNENLDTARCVFFEELKNRIINMPMKDAALEVNHWCHEKVNYEGSDARTSAPLSTVKTSHGRCGEESTFAVTALRAVGIPARQVYTPRWASCDDNHAWVEVWIDGKWYYLGACEPEPELNMGWFTERARRAMLVHTKVFGDFSGDGEILSKTNNFTEINVTANYADVKKIFVRVTDPSGKNVENARVDFGLYNYAEFYPIFSQKTDSRGLASLTTGYGDLLIWASKDVMFAYEKISVGMTDTVILKLSGKKINAMSVDYDIIPPVEKTPLQVNQDKAAANNIRLKQEDIIREQYRTTFIDSVSSFAVAVRNEIDKSQTWKFLKLSEGNWREIISFMDNTKPGYRYYIFPLLSCISQKDLRDTKADILLNHLNTTLNYYKPGNSNPEEVFFNYVLNPRVKEENMTGYRDILHNAFARFSSPEAGKAAGKLVYWIKNNIKLNDSENSNKVAITPEGVFSLRVSDQQSRDIFFVAACRSIGVAARLEPALKIPQYYDGKQWRNVYFESKSRPQPETGEMIFKPVTINMDNITDPKYYTHFTIAKLENGVYKTLDYESEPRLSEMPEKIKLDEGFYRLVTGNRRDDGAVFSELTYFSINKGKTTAVPLTIRACRKSEKVFGQIKLYSEQQDNCLPVNLSEMLKQNYMVIGWIEPGKEPTRHVIEELKALKGNFEKWSGKLVLVIPQEKKVSAFNGDIVRDMPANTIFYDDKDNKIFNQVKDALTLENTASYPLFVVLDNNGRIVTYTQGYKIGTGEQLLKALKPVSN